MHPDPLVELVEVAMTSLEGFVTSIWVVDVIALCKWVQRIDTLLLKAAHQ
jgi:hypothetical protein